MSEENSVSVSERAASVIPKAPPGQAAIEAHALVKSYGRGAKAVQALREVSFTVPPGSVFGLLGPNGAGKTTIVKILTTLTLPDSGRATVAGYDVAAEGAKVRRVIGYVPQKPSFDPTATGRENLMLQGRIHSLPRRQLRQRVDELLERFRLVDAADRVTHKWSGGMQRKLDVALALVHRPSVLFLDEPTTGLDPEARAELWAEIARLAQNGDLAVLLTTHYLEEADQLADNLAIVDQGRVVAAGTPDALKDALNGDTIHVRLTTAADVGRAREALEKVPGVHDTTVEDRELWAKVSNGAAALPEVISALDGARVEIAAVTAARPSLDEVYLRHAGRSFRSAEESAVRMEVTNR